MIERERRVDAVIEKFFGNVEFRPGGIENLPNILEGAGLDNVPAGSVPAEALGTSDFVEGAAPRAPEGAASAAGLANAAARFVAGRSLASEIETQDDLIRYVGECLSDGRAMADRGDYIGAASLFSDKAQEFRDFLRTDRAALIVGDIGSAEAKFVCKWLAGFFFELRGDVLVRAAGKGNDSDDNYNEAFKAYDYSASCYKEVYTRSDLLTCRILR